MFLTKAFSVRTIYSK